MNYEEGKQLSVVRSLNPAKHICLCIKAQCIYKINVLNNKIPINLIFFYMKKGSKIGNLKQENTYEGKIKKKQTTHISLHHKPQAFVILHKLKPLAQEMR